MTVRMGSVNCLNCCCSLIDRHMEVCAVLMQALDAKSHVAWHLREYGLAAK